ncbi:MAG TPA: hypothetical protein VGP72_16470 [Planctomycetota bacterium]|jgi:hypothetical protein
MKIEVWRSLPRLPGEPNSPRSWECHIYTIRDEQRAEFYQTINEINALGLDAEKGFELLRRYYPD